MINSGPCCVPQRAVDTALEVNGANVSMYGLMAEHTNKDIVIWNGEEGETFMYQSEFRYAAGLKSKPDTWDVGRYVSYRVNAVSHKAVGFGIYAVVYPGDDKPLMQPLQMQGGFSAIAVLHADTYRYGFQDINAMNWNRFPRDSRITCKTWDAQSSSCIDYDVAFLGWNVFSIVLLVCLLVILVVLLIWLLCRWRKSTFANRSASGQAASTPVIRRTLLNHGNDC